MEQINFDNPPKPCDVFDMIGGTNTGGLIAVMLGRLEMDVDSCITAYTELSDCVFQQKKLRISISNTVHGKFDSEELKSAIQLLVQRYYHDKDALLKHPGAKCKVFVCAMSKEMNRTVALRSYRNPRGVTHLYESTKIWEACRATSAATSFFDPISIGIHKNTFIDGAIGANNPIWELWKEASSIWPAQGSFDNNINCLVSIGTGMPSITPFGDKLMDIGKSLVEIATETERTASTFSEQNSSLEENGRYFRFNVAQGLQGIGLEEAREQPRIVAATDGYLEDRHVYRQIRQCRDRLVLRQVPPRNSGMSHYQPALPSPESPYSISMLGTLDSSREKEKEKIPQNSFYM